MSHAMKRWIPFAPKPPAVAVVRLQGSIASGHRPGALNDESLAPILERAFRRGRPKAVALVVNSPGGSAAQSSLIAARVRRLSEERKVAVHAFVEDVAASGGYWLACAADDIWVDPNSIVGSIGVIFSGFGFPELLSRWGVERRVHAAGRSKSMLDPFRPEKPEDIEKLKAWQEQIHESFIDHVKSRRGDRLEGGDELFTGDVWVGKKAVEIGLVDGVAHAVPKLKELYGEKTRFMSYGPRRSLFQRLGSRFAEDALAIAEERCHFSRYGL